MGPEFIKGEVSCWDWMWMIEDFQEFVGRKRRFWEPLGRNLAEVVDIFHHKQFKPKTLINFHPLDQEHPSHSSTKTIKTFI